MDHSNGTPPHPQSTGREAFLAIVLALFVGFGAVIALVFVTGGFFAYVILIGIGLALVSGLHYLLWGWAMPTNAKTDEQQLENGDEVPTPPTPWERRF